MSMIRFSLIMVALLTSFSVYAAEVAKSTVLKHSEPNFQIRLPANPTTGYSWFLKSYDHRLLHVVNYHFEAPQSTLLGAGGEAIWSFRAVPEAFKVPVMTQIVMVYMRQDDPNTAEVKTFTFVTHSCRQGEKQGPLQLQRMTCG